jgi:hypothetical protein
MRDEPVARQRPGSDARADGTLPAAASATAATMQSPNL